LEHQGVGPIIGGGFERAGAGVEAVSAGSLHTVA